MPEAGVSAREFAEAMRAEFERVMDGVAAAVNDAPDGRWIRGSEEKVRDLFAEFRRLAYQKALQMRTDAAEASFPPPADPATGGWIGPAALSAVPALEAALKDESPEVRNAAAEALRQLRGPR